MLQKSPIMCHLTFYGVDQLRPSSLITYNTNTHTFVIYSIPSSLYMREKQTLLLPRLSTIPLSRPQASAPFSRYCGGGEASSVVTLG